ncbi:MAG: asparagine synthase C-terminal domain-containing protein [Methanoregula sp.]|nr:asparagine synthase C-terminal domain-containing protein [Methanoregula sp.]
MVLYNIRQVRLVFHYNGWIELDGKRLSHDEVEEITRMAPETIRRFGGEFALSFGDCQARDHFGICPGPSPKGAFVCNGAVRFPIEPYPVPQTLADAICMAVKLRSDEGITALSGGVDSSLVAVLAQRECLAVGLAGSHDLMRAQHAAKLFNLSCTSVVITRPEIEVALPQVVNAIPIKDPVNTSIALTQYFIARGAHELGYERILTGQGADELFGGYARYLTTKTLADDLIRDVAALEMQVIRDQSVAALHDTYLSMPYMDIRVVRAALAIPAEEKVKDGERKVPLRRVAEQYMPEELAGYGKKAMQYGSGIWGELKKLARKNGYKTSVQDYIDQILRVEHGH